MFFIIHWVLSSTYGTKKLMRIKLAIDICMLKLGEFKYIQMIFNFSGADFILFECLSHPLYLLTSISW